MKTLLLKNHDGSLGNMRFQAKRKYALETLDLNSKMREILF